MNKKFIVLVFLGMFFGCLGLSKLASYYLDISSDYLTATATFFATFVALYLYSDWKDPLKYSKFQSEQSEIRFSIRVFRNNYYEFVSHVLDFKNGESATGDYKKKFMKLERQMLNSLDDLTDNLKFYSHNFIREIHDEDYKNHKENLIIYSREVQNFYAPFMQNNSYADFLIYFAIIDSKIKTNFFVEIVEKFSKDLPSELAIISKKIIDIDN